jgi:hypothetical protein
MFVWYEPTRTSSDTGRSVGLDSEGFAAAARDVPGDVVLRLHETDRYGDPRATAAWRSAERSLEKYERAAASRNRALVDPFTTSYSRAIAQPLERFTTAYSDAVAGPWQRWLSENERTLRALTEWAARIDWAAVERALQDLEAEADSEEGEQPTSQAFALWQATLLFAFLQMLAASLQVLEDATGVDVPDAVQSTAQLCMAVGTMIILMLTRRE